MSDREHESEIELNPDGTIKYSFVPSEPQSDPPGDGFVVPRATPKGAVLRSLDENSAVVELRVARELWWWLTPILAGAQLAILAPVSLSLMLLPIMGGSAAIGLFLLAFSILVVVFAIINLRTTIRIEIDDTCISIGNLRFDREFSNLFTLGYSVKSEDPIIGLLNADVSRHSLGLTGLRLQYGPWGEDLPYLVSKYHSAEIVVWLNEIVQQVGAVEYEGDDAGRGIKTELL